MSETIRTKFNILFAVMRCHRAKEHMTPYSGVYGCDACEFRGTWVEYLRHIRQLPDVVALERKDL